MAEMTPGEPQHAADYADRTTAAVKTVLIEIGQILGSFKGKFAVVGGAVPWLLLDNEDMRHVGTIDVDIGLDPAALGDGEYATLVESLLGHGYEQRKKRKRFQLVRTVGALDGGAPIDYSVRNYPGGPDALAEACRPLLAHDSGAAGFRFIAAKFDTPDGYGPSCVRRFVEESKVLGDRTPDQWQQDAFGQVDAWLRALGLRM